MSASRATLTGFTPREVARLLRVGAGIPCTSAVLRTGVLRLHLRECHQANPLFMAANLMATTKLMVGIVLLSALGVLSHWGLAALERLVIPWREG